MKKRGFTLVEMVVSIVIMAVVMTAVLSAIGNFIQTSRKLDTMRHVQQETTFALTRITDKIRGDSVDYKAYEGTGKCAKVGTKIDSSEHICLGDGWEVIGDTVEGTLILKKDGKEAPLLSDDIEVVTATFQVTPEKDPNDPGSWGNPDLQRQPLVTIDLAVVSRQNPAIHFSIQTSVSSRAY